MGVFTFLPTGLLPDLVRIFAIFVRFRRFASREKVKTFQ